MLTAVFLQMQAESLEQDDSQVKPLQHTPPYTTMHVLTALFFQVQAEAREQQESQVKSLHHTPPIVSPSYTTIHHHAPPCTALTAIFFQLQLPPPGVPRGARLYIAEAPRPPLPLRKGSAGESRRREDVEFETYVRTHAPEEGAQPCWPCPFCIIARFYCGRHHLFRHLRDTHKDKDVSAAQIAVCHAQADVCCLVWCRKRNAMQGWQAILQ